MYFRIAGPNNLDRDCEVCRKYETDSEGSPIKRSGKYFERKKPPVCDRCPKNKHVSLKPENEEIYHRYILACKCGLDIELEEDDYYFFALISKTEQEAERTALEISIKRSIAEVF